MLLDEFNGLDRAAAIAALRPCIDIQRWCEEIADARPFASRAELLRAAEGAARPIHGRGGRGGARAPSADRRARRRWQQRGNALRAEQSGVDSSDSRSRTLSPLGTSPTNEAGQVFLIAAAGKIGR